MRSTIARCGAVALSVVLLSVFGSGLAVVGGQQSATAGAASPVTKVLTIVEENHSLDQMRSGMPYLFGLAKSYSYATNWTAIRHPSLPNYLAIAGGSTFGVTDDAGPSSHPVAGDSVFDKAIAAGRTAKTYVEGMSGNCSAKNIGQYVVKHNPWVYFNGKTQRAHCMAYDVPAGTTSSGALASDITNGKLPTVGMLIPNLCNDAHDCGLSTADAWLKKWLPKILGGSDFTSGRLAVVITADEDSGKSGNKVLTVVLHSTLKNAHRVVTTHMTHYSLTRLYGRVSGAPLLGAANSAPGMRPAFHLP